MSEPISRVEPSPNPSEINELSQLLSNWAWARAVNLTEPVEPMKVAAMIRDGDRLADFVRAYASGTFGDGTT